MFNDIDEYFLVDPDWDAQEPIEVPIPQDCEDLCSAY